ncbi:MAG: hypothetical protein D6722_12155, partial [Bacteroidetes bacterium]
PETGQPDRRLSTSTGQDFLVLRPWQSQGQASLLLVYQLSPRQEVFFGPDWQLFLNGGFGGLASGSQMRARSGLSLGIRFR